MCCPSTQISRTVISFLVSVPVLSVQMTVVRAERLDGRQLLDERVALRHPLHAHGEREAHRRQQALGDVGDDDADGEQEALDRASARRRSSRGRRRATPRPMASTATSRTTLLHLLLQRAELLLRRSGSARRSCRTACPCRWRRRPPCRRRTRPTCRRTRGSASRSASGRASLCGDDVLRTGSDSPVSVALFVRSSNSSISRASAEMLSPSSSTMMSPGTISDASDLA